MDKPRQTVLQPRVLASLGLLMLAAGVGLVLGYDFGVQVGRTRWLGYVAALCGAAFCSLLADAAASRLLARPKR